MASTNKTTNYELSQYIGTDKPTYLTDYNQDMTKIDAGIHAAKAEADSNATNIGDLTSLTTTVKTSAVAAINELDSDLGTLSTTVGNHTTAIADNTSHIGDLTNLSTTAKNNLVSAINEVDANGNTNSSAIATNTSAIGTLSSLITTNKSDLVSAINEVAELEKYSTTEEPIGTYADGKTIYRKVLTNIGTLNNTDTLMYFTLNTNVDKCINAKIFMHSSDNTKDTMLPILAVTPLRDETTVNLSTHELILEVSREHQVHYSGNTLYGFIEYTKYSE